MTDQKPNLPGWGCKLYVGTGKGEEQVERLVAGFLRCLKALRDHFQPYFQTFIPFNYVSQYGQPNLK